MLCSNQEKRLVQLYYFQNVLLFYNINNVITRGRRRMIGAETELEF